MAIGDVLDPQIPAVLTGGAMYGAVLAGIAGTLLTQAALHYGPLAISQPFMVIVNPLVSIIRGVWLYGEHFTDGAPTITIGALGFAAMVIGVVLLACGVPKLGASHIRAAYAAR
ncbi:MAG TPA: hypothetical protein VGJ28_12525 [Micromonosporaceae bacterium]